MNKLSGVLIAFFLVVIGVLIGVLIPRNEPDLIPRNSVPRSIFPTFGAKSSPLAGKWEDRPFHSDLSDIKVVFEFLPSGDAIRTSYKNGSLFSSEIYKWRYIDNNRIVWDITAGDQIYYFSIKKDNLSLKGYGSYDLNRLTTKIISEPKPPSMRPLPSPPPGIKGPG